MNNVDRIIELLHSGTKIGCALREVCGHQKISIPFNDEIFDVRIEELKLSNRSYNSLKREGLNTLNDVVKHFSTRGWNSIKNFGKKSANEMFEKIIEVAWNNMNDRQKAIFLLSAS